MTTLAEYLDSFGEVAIAAMRKTGILAGWALVPDCSIPEHEYSVTCLACPCKFGFVRRVPDFLIEHARFDMRHDIGENVKAQFSEQAKDVDCPHWEAYKQLTHS